MTTIYYSTESEYPGVWLLNPEAIDELDAVLASIWKDLLRLEGKVIEREWLDAKKRYGKKDSDYLKKIITGT